MIYILKLHLLHEDIGVRVGGMKLARAIHLYSKKSDLKDSLSPCAHDSPPQSRDTKAAWGH